MTIFRIKALFFAIIFVFAGLITGCDTYEDYGTALITTHERTKIEVKQIDFQNIKISIRRYRAMNNGKNPESLEEIGKFMGTTLDPELYSYDPETGDVTQAPQFR
ncbi:MAG TPA: hypothetical protein ENH31_06785 [Nitrospirae bacterium]|nr:hypothetical protein BMS3Abin10_00637 [bacterium BMS3Abin10]GBE37555.1 hypothetical protein BMS3Bbin08_00145 [bacterium BMS3Bbin08]HDH50877.1 hypothetical protein [Nitrospirota bacterium]HDK16539.1 hypothetical protein [Nitrospirota bacterium]HDK82261.1 hypothetical protein [Nitrospirota bacterium]